MSDTWLSYVCHLKGEHSKTVWSLTMTDLDVIAATLKFHALFVMAHMKFYALFVVVHMKFHALIVMAQIEDHAFFRGRGGSTWQYPLAEVLPPWMGHFSFGSRLLVWCDRSAIGLRDDPT